MERIDQFFFRNLVYNPTTFLLGQYTSQKLERLLHSERLPKEQLAELQKRKLQRLLNLARRDCLEYTKRLQAINPVTATAATLRDIAPLDKQALRTLRGRLITTRRSNILVTAKTTGGSTGEPVTVLKNAEAMGWELAAAWRGYGWAGISIGDRQVRLWGVPISASGRMRARMADWICHRYRFSAFHFDERQLQGYVERMGRFPIDYVYGYVSMISLLARWMMKNGTYLKTKPKAVITTSEVLTAADRAIIADGFHCRVFNEYGCGEVGTIAHECEAGRLHVNDENLILEVLSGDTPCRPGEVGELVVTELNNTHEPLIRYRTGDFGTLSDRPCECGRSLSVLEHVFGREYDFIVTPEGKLLHPEAIIYVFEDAQRRGMGIAQFKVVQAATDRLSISVIPSPRGFSATDRETLCAAVRAVTSDSMRIELHSVSTIPRESSGKLRVVAGLTGLKPTLSPAEFIHS